MTDSGARGDIGTVGLRPAQFNSKGKAMRRITKRSRRGAPVRRFLAASAAAMVTLLAFSGGASAGIVTPHFIYEPFTGASIDYTHTWAWWGSNQPGAVQFTQASGVMNINVAASAQDDFNVSGATRCAARGDFDAVVQFNLPTWPSADGVWVSLMATGTPFNVYRVTWQFNPNEQYGAYFPPAGTSVPATGTNGWLRLSRRGDIFTGYYLNGLSWVPIVSGVGPTSDAGFTLAVFNISGASPFGAKAAAVTFDNFTATADRIICP